MKNKLECVLFEIIKEYFHENRENLFKYPTTTLEPVIDLIKSFRIKCLVNELGESNEKN